MNRVYFKDMAHEKRLRVVRLDPDAVLNLLKHGPGARIVSGALPEDAKVASIGHDENGIIAVIVSSASFDEVPNNARIPEHADIVLEAVR